MQPISPLRAIKNVPAPDPQVVLAELLKLAGLGAAMPREIELSGAEPVLPSSFAVGTAAQAVIAAAALAAARLWRLRTGRRQRVSVDMRNAAIEFRSERYLRVDGKYPADDPDRLSGLYRCGDGRWVRLHTSLPHHYRGMLALRLSARSRNGKPRRSKPQPPMQRSSRPRAVRLPSGIGIHRAARSPRFRCSASSRSVMRRLKRCHRQSVRLPE
jgi:hypothetical protein